MDLVIKVSPSSAEGKKNRRASLRKSLFRHFGSDRIHHKNKSSKNNILTRGTPISRVSSQESIKVISHSTTQEDNGVVRMKILVRKEDLEKVLDLMRNNNNDNNKNDNGADVEDELSASLWIEERLNMLRNRQHRRQNSWSPALQTITEEMLA